MNKRAYKIIITCLLSAALLPLAAAVYEYVVVYDAGRLFSEGKYDEALDRYHKVSGIHPDDPSIRYNMGIALYMKKEYQKAEASFAAALESGEREIRNKASFNIGNCLYRQGRQAEAAELKTAAALYGKALDYYRTALRINDRDRDARYNMRLTEKRLQDITMSGLQKTQGQKNGEWRSGDKENRSLTDQHQTGGSARKELIGNPEGEQGKRSDKAASRFKAGGNAGAPLSKEDAEMLLDEYRRNGKLLGGLLKNVKGKGHYEVEKDW